jgi:hypothetical protein
VKGVELLENNIKEKILVWLVDEAGKVNPMNAAHRYVVYLFKSGEKVNLKNSANIVQITSQPYYRIPADLKGKYTFVVTVLDRLQNESTGVKCKVKL